MKRDGHGPFLNTDRELWREPPGDYYANSVHVTESGGLGINVGGTVFVKSLRAWHEAAKDHDAAEERGRRRGLGEAATAHPGCMCDFCRRALAPRDSGKEPARMDAPGGPVCWCGKPSRYENGWCGMKYCELLSDEAEPLP